VTKMTRIGWIGLGKLGLPMAQRLATAGYAVTGFDRDPARLATAGASGVAPANGMQNAAAGAQVVFTSLPDDHVLRAVTMGDDGLLQSMAEGAILAETSTVSVEVSAEVARKAEELGISYLRLPMSGNPTLAETGSLTCFASGPRAAFETVQPLTAAFTRAQTYLGNAEEARFAKLAINLMIAVSANMMAESLALARKGNIGWADMLTVLSESAVGSPMVKYKVPPLLERDFTSTFSCRQMAKDLDLILGAGRSAAVPLPLAALTRETYAALIAAGEGDEDYIATVKHAERLAGLAEPSI
jgi:3-hydroxyisobutyrate dehydrogenase-like beta-hydroxyacid dehydrogenase